MTGKEFNKKIKGVFKPLKRRFYFGKHKFYTPYFTPWGFNENIITVRKLKGEYKNKPMVRRIKNWTLSYYISIGWPVAFKTVSIGFKDKWNTPRYEWAPSFQIWFFKWQFVMWWGGPIKDKFEIANYFEQSLWYLFYCEEYGSDKPDIKLAKENWPWQNREKNSTWCDDYLIKNDK